MSDYTTEAEGSVRARRRRRSLITLAVVVLGLFFAFWYAWSYYQADTEARASRPPAPFIYRNPRNAAEAAKAERPLVPAE